MGHADDLLACLGLERRIYAIFYRWVDSTNKQDADYDLLIRMADESDRHRSWLLDLARRLGGAPPTLPELQLENEASFAEEAKVALRRLQTLLPRVAEGLDASARSTVVRIQREDEAQLRQLLSWHPEPRITMLPELVHEPLGRYRPGRERAPMPLTGREPMWRPGTE